jgi:energy-coupling factor transporter ATP-binding protein EcfA2
MKIEERDMFDFKLKKSKQTIDDILPVPAPFPSKPSVIAIIGAMGSGKSSLLNSLMSGKGKSLVYRGVFSKVHYVTPEAVFQSEVDHAFKDHPPERIYHDLQPDTMDKIIEQLVEVKEEGENSAVVIDDMGEELKDKSVQKRLQTLIFKHRHYKTAIFLTMIAVKLLPKQFRPLIDVYIVYRPRGTEIESLNDDVFNLAKDDLKQLLEYVFDAPYNFLFYNQRTNTYYKGFGKGGISELKISNPEM